MNEWNSGNKEDRAHAGLEDRLKAYYGPALREQPLPSTSWQHLRLQLDPQRSPAHQCMRWRPSRRFRIYRTAPTHVQNAFSRITYEARLPYAPSMLSCSMRPHVRVPGVRVFLLGRRKIRLRLPSDPARSPDPPELDVLLATGLARYICMRKPVYALRRLLLSSIIPLVCVVLALLWLHGLSRFALLIAGLLCCALCVVALWLLHIQGRSMAIQADGLMVLWLGRGRACQGLHALADRSRTASRKRWADLSLVERIGRVCGTQVRVEDQRLTLVR